jgi:hypothetical protein
MSANDGNRLDFFSTVALFQSSFTAASKPLSHGFRSFD